MSDKNVNKPQQLNIHLGEDVAEGTYANMAMITHSHTEFVLDFIRLMPGIAKAKVKSRIIMTPQHAKRLLRALNENIAKYESVHGPIKDVDTGKLPMNFGGPAAQA